MTSKLNKLDLRIDHYAAELMSSVTIILVVGIFCLYNFLHGFNAILYGLSIFVTFFLCLFYPRAGIYSMVILTFVFERFFTLVPIYLDRTLYKIYPLDFFIIAIAAGTILKLVYDKCHHKQITKFSFSEYAFLVVLAWIAFEWVFHFLIKKPENNLIAFSTFKNYFFYPILYFLVIYLFPDKKELSRLLNAFIAGGVIVTTFVVIGAIRGEGLWSEYTPLSTSGTRILAFTHAFYLQMALIILLIKQIYLSNSFKRHYILIASVWLIGIVGSLMRHLWIALTITFITLIFLVEKETKKRMLKIFGHAAFIVVISVSTALYLAMLFPNNDLSKGIASGFSNVEERIFSTFNTQGDESLNWRQNVWQSAVQKWIASSPIMGTGFGSFVSVEIGPKYRSFVEMRDLHNSVLAFVIQTGLIGFVLLAVYLISIILTLLKKLKTKDERENYLVFASLVLLVNYGVAFLFQPYLEINLLGIFFWIILAIARVSSNKSLI